MESTNKGSETAASEQLSPSEKQNPNLNVQLTTQETSTASARKSGGPRTQEGKERSKYNAAKHGIFSKVVVIDGESRAEFRALLNGLRDYHQPVGMLEEILVDKLAALFWRQRRLIIADGEVNIRRGKAFIEIDVPPKWEHLLRYETTLDRAIDRTLAQFQQLQRIRLGQPVLPRIDENLSSS